MAQPKQSQLDDIIRVLHVDDETTHLKYAKRFLEMADESLHIESMTSPEEALRRLESETYDCIVSDFQMPGMHGIELARKIRETSNIPIIIYTGRGSEEVAEAAFSVGINDYIRKETTPSHYPVLARRIRAAVEKHRAENALKESEGKYRSLVQNSRDGVMVFTGTELVYANQQAVALHGCSSVEDLVKFGPSNLLHPEDREWVEERSLTRQSGEDVPPLSEFRLVLPDGIVRTVQSSSSVIEYSGKTSTLAFLRDTTERKLVEEKLIGSEQKYRDMAENLRVLIYRADPDTFETTYINRAIEEFYGYSPEEWIEDPSLWGKTIHPEDLERVFTEFSEARSRRESGDISYRIVRRDGSVRWVEDHFNWHIDDQGSLIALYGSVYDITERMKMEEELRIYSMDLESRVEKRTKELLAAEQMIAAGSIAAMVGHDLRGPLQTIKNAAYLLRKSPENLEKSLKIIGDSVDRAVKMIEKFRDQTREDPLTVSDNVDLGELMVRAVAEASIPDDVNAVVEVGDGLESVSVDASKFRRIMDNLVKNAVDAMPRGGALKVEAHQRDGEIRVEVSDTGEGIPEEVMGGLFTPFHTTKAGGLGLGLAFCKRAVEAHGGTILVESEVDRGTTFTLRMPMKQG